MRHVVLAVSAAILFATPLQAKDCPVQDVTAEAKEDAVRKAPSCQQALEVMKACAYGATGDRGLADALQERCEPVFVLKLSKAQKKAYDREQKRCDDKYAKESGSMYRSFSAFCQAQSTVTYAKRFGVKAR
jgi:hypothetical protein